MQQLYTVACLNVNYYNTSRLTTNHPLICQSYVTACIHFIIIIIIIVLTSICPRLHGSDGSKKCHLSTQRDLAYLHVSARVSSNHLPHTPSKSVYLYLYLFPMQQPVICVFSLQ